ncbi:uncharacterized protein LOC134210402 [Armigeres subalbatus]|uniref:uncharacterized protein LOC134210402 n=1 Tax=Armigeres subalbatus TaxID=124917 RepID=UPI002ED4C32D
MEQLIEDMFAATHGTPRAEIAAVTHGQPRGQSPNQNTNALKYHFNTQPRYFGNFRGSRGGRGFGRREFTKNIVQCWRCLSKQHHPSQCHAMDKICHNCGQKGHLVRVCRMKPVSHPMKRRNSNDDRNVAHAKKVALVAKDEEDSTEEPEILQSNSIIRVLANENVPSFDDSRERQPLLIDETEINENNNIKPEIALATAKFVRRFRESSSGEKGIGLIVGKIAGVDVTFLIDSGADVNTIGADTFDILMNNNESRQKLCCIREGSDIPLKAYATSEEINVVATFETELAISEDRPQFMEKFYAIQNARALLGRNTAI